MKKLFLLRHGETEMNLKKVYYGHIDCDLTLKGAAQAEALAKVFSALPLDRVYVSPLLRAKRTADLILGAKDVARIVDDRLRELNFGDWEGKSYEDLKHDALYAAWCDDWRQTRPPGGESFDDLAARTSAFFEELGAEEDGNVLIVAHHAVLQQLMTYLLEEDVGHCWHYGFEQGTYTYFEFSGDYAVLKGHNLPPLSDI